MSVRDATFLQNARQDSFWLYGAYVAAGFRSFGPAVLQQPPPVITANPWLVHTRGEGLVAWFSDWDILTKDEAVPMRLLLSQRYVKITSSLAGGGEGHDGRRVLGEYGTARRHPP